MCLSLSESTIVPADPHTGRVRAEDVSAALRPSTRLVSIMLANNETGIVQPLREVVCAVRAWEQRNASALQGRRILVHTDAAQVREEARSGILISIVPIICCFVFRL